ncbi:MAG TPA: SCO family protein [Geminicoccaceae bacterium]|nr:SCO family protein [Geminicoccaceae bacterium]
MRRALVLGLLAGLALILVAAGAGWLWHVASDPGRAEQSQGPVPIGGPFTLTDQDGRRVTAEDFRGRYMLVLFGYTFCPDMCPLGLTTMADALDALPPAKAARIVPLFITVDPERDTVEVMKAYVPLFHERLLGLTGTPEEVAEVVKEYRVYARKAAPDEGGGYLVDHSTFTYLMDTEGRYLAHFGHDATAEEMAARLATLVPG